ncbi:MAG: DUF4153 domain-containing protein [Candidatus Limnocylindria bacterium]
MNTRRAGDVLTVAAVLGVLGQLLFYDMPLGVNLVSMMAAILVAAWLLRPADARLDPPDAWLPAGALVLAAFVAVRADPALAFVDTIGALTLTAAAAAAVAGVPVVRRSAFGIAALAGRFIGLGTVAAGPVVASAGRASRPFAARVPGGRALPVVRGAGIALPIVLVFLGLFVAADAVFARRVGDLFAVSSDVTGLIGRTAYAVVIGWIVAGVLAVVAFRLLTTDATDGAGSASRAGWRLGTTEAVVVVVALDLLFAAFVSVQVEYLFGGRDTLEAYGFSYSSYARRGFFELVAVAALAGALLLFFERFVAARIAVYIGACVSLCALIGVVLGSAAQRLSLYQQAYGWTELRFYVLAAIVWLAVCVAIAIVATLTNRSRWLFHGVSVAAIVIAIGVNAIGPQAFVASANVERALDASLVPANGETGLDELYLANLGDDAIPIVADALPRLDPEDRDALAWSLATRLARLDADEGSRTWPAWNLSRERARAALEAMRADLPEVVSIDEPVK